MGPLVGDQGQGGGTPVGGPDSLSGPVDVFVDRALGDVQEAGDFLGLVMARDQPQTLALARRQGLESRFGLCRNLPHRWRLAQAARNASGVNLTVLARFVLCRV